MDDCFRFIETARCSENGGVLVHCFMGYSRSATIVLSYLMRKEGLSLKEAKELVMKVGRMKARCQIESTSEKVDRNGGK